MQLNIDIPDQLVESLPKAITQELLPELATAALTEWAEWLNGSFRPMSISELETRRIFDLYDRILVDETPSAERMGEILGLPMGRARYVMQNLAYRHGGMLRRRQAQAISEALRNAAWSEQRDNCVVTIDFGCRDIMDRTIRSLAAQGIVESIVSGEATLEGVRYELGPNHHDALAKAFSEGFMHPQSKS